jgi:AraC-like DNA-binding protein
MGKMGIPAHIPAAPSRLKAALDSFFATGGFRKVYLASHRGLPRSGYSPWGLTRVPFILINIAGRIDVGFLDSTGVRQDITLRPHEGMFFCSNTWMDCDNHTSDQYFRVTLDTDHTLFGMQDRTSSFPYAGKLRGSMELHPCPRLPDPFCRSLVAYLESLDADSAHSARRLAASLTLLTLGLGELLSTAPPESPPGKARATWMSLRSYVDEHCFEPDLSRESVARAFRLNPGHVSRLFASQAGEPFLRYVERLRMLHARMLLVNSTLTVDEAAHACGFSGLSYFVRVFRKAYGMPPGQYRSAVKMRAGE